MKRSEINAIIRHAIEFFELNHFRIPEWAYWSPGDWKGSYDKCFEIVDNKLGWDITDFGSNDFKHTGLSLFTIRNGSWDKQDKTYCEKIMIADEDQETPLHYHWNKTEDIINRGGGNLVLELFTATSDDKLSKDPVSASIDGIVKKVLPGEKLVLTPGNSICLKPRVYHRFYGEAGKGPVLIGEVSVVNDDAKDNRFYKTTGRFPEIIEDEKPLHLLVNDYRNYL